MDELLRLIKLNEDAFYASVAKRMLTSTGNVSRHADVLNALDENDYVALKEALYNPWYIKPLEGVVICMEVEYDVKEEMIQAYNKMKGGL